MPERLELTGDARHVEALDAPLVTCDARIARAHGHTVDVEILTETSPG